MHVIMDNTQSVITPVNQRTCLPAIKMNEQDEKL